MQVEVADGVATRVRRALLIESNHVSGRTWRDCGRLHDRRCIGCVTICWGL